mmetsp:Transcript_3877/g.15653  ORF Transcript_3877/g.15653 Transcript_3877/m.15653 type:complete len:210 (+) Transcript_3877:113-742(+)
MCRSQIWGAHLNVCHDAEVVGSKQRRVVVVRARKYHMRADAARRAANENVVDRRGRVLVCERGLDARWVCSLRLVAVVGGRMRRPESRVAQQRERRLVRRGVEVTHQHRGVGGLLVLGGVQPVQYALQLTHAHLWRIAVMMQVAIHHPHAPGMTRTSRGRGVLLRTLDSSPGDIADARRPVMGALFGARYSVVRHNAEHSVRAAHVAYA